MIWVSNVRNRTRLARGAKILGQHSRYTYCRSPSPPPESVRSEASKILLPGKMEKYTAVNTWQALQGCSTKREHDTHTPSQRQNEK